jgi:hypothetical protein
MMNGHVAQQHAIVTREQKAHFDIFGFLVLRQAFSADEIRIIDREFDTIMAEALREQGFNEEAPEQLDRKFVIDPGFVEKQPALRALLDDARVCGTLEGLLGTGCYYTGSDGSLRAGDTLWHPDQGWDPSIPEGRADPGLAEARGHYYPGIKVAFYLDPLVKDGGCLSVIPGSHRGPLHEALWSLHCDIPERGQQLLAPPYINQFRLTPSDIPCFPVQTRPGDVVFFSHQLWHSAFGGRTGRRMFALGYKAKPTNDIERKYAKRFLPDI